MAQLLVDLMIDRVDLVDEGANSEAFIKLYKRRNKEMTFEELLKSLPEEQATLINDEMKKVDEAKLEEYMAKAKLEAEAEIATIKAEAEAEIAKAKEEAISKSKTEETPEDIIKSLDPAVQAIFKSLEEKKIAAETIAKQLKEDQEKEETIAKAKELKALPVDESKLFDIAKAATPEIYEVLKSVSKALEDSEIFKEKGNNSKGDVDAWSKIEKAAATVAERDGITKAKAIAVVMKEQPELYKEYLKGGM